MNYLIKNMPDFEKQRSQILQGVKEFPCPFYLDERGYNAQVGDLKRTTAALNEIISVYGRFFIQYENTFENFKNLILPWVLKKADEKVFAKDVKARWIADNRISIQLKGEVKLNTDKELHFLLDSLEFPEKIHDVTKSLFNLIRGCSLLPHYASYRDLWSDSKLMFVVTEELKATLVERHTVHCASDYQLKAHILASQLCDALNGLYDIGFGLIGPLPRQLEMLLDRTTDPALYGTKGHTFRFSHERVLSAIKQKVLINATDKDRSELIINN